MWNAPTEAYNGRIVCDTCTVSLSLRSDPPADKMRQITSVYGWAWRNGSDICPDCQIDIAKQAASHLLDGLI